MSADITKRPADPAALKAQIVEQLRLCEAPIYRDGLMKRCSLATDYTQFSLVFGELLERGIIVKAGGQMPRLTYALGEGAAAAVPATGTASPPSLAERAEDGGAVTAPAAPKAQHKRKGGSPKGAVKGFLLDLIRVQERTAVQLAELSSLNTSTVLYHLKAMKEAGQIVFHKDRAAYSLAEQIQGQAVAKETTSVPPAASTMSPAEERQSRRAHVVLGERGEKGKIAQETPSDTEPLQLVLQKGKVKLIELTIHASLSAILVTAGTEAIKRLAGHLPEVASA